MLNTKDSFRLYGILQDHLPKDVDADVTVFIGKILDSMIEAGEHRKYVQAIHIMWGKSLEEMKEMSPEETIDLFTSGLIENKILKLRGFFEGL